MTKEKPFILHALSPTKIVSPFDINMAYDSGFDNVATDTSYHFVKCGNLRNKSLSAPPILEIIPFMMSRDGFSSATNRGGSVQYISTTQKCPINCEKLYRHHQFQI